MYGDIGYKFCWLLPFEDQTHDTPIGNESVIQIMKFVATVIPSVEFDICSLELEYVSWSHNKWDL